MPGCGCWSHEASKGKSDLFSFPHARLSLLLLLSSSLFLSLSLSLPLSFSLALSFFIFALFFSLWCCNTSQHIPVFFPIKFLPFPKNLPYLFFFLHLFTRLLSFFQFFFYLSCFPHRPSANSDPRFTLMSSVTPSTLSLLRASPTTQRRSSTMGDINRRGKREKARNKRRTVKDLKRERQGDMETGRQGDREIEEY